MKLSSILICSILFLGAAVGATLEDLQTAFMSRYDEANQKRDQQLQKLEASYLGALGRHMDKVTASGRLEEVIPVRDEIDAVKAGTDPLPKLPENADGQLKRMRGQLMAAKTKVLKNHAETLLDLSEKMNQALLTKESELTRAGRIDDALAAKRMRETLGNDPGLKAAREAMVVVPSGGVSWIPLVGGDNWTIKSSGSYWVGDLEGKQGQGSFDTNMKPRLAELKVTNEAPHFLAAAPATVVFNFDRPCSEIDGKLWIHDKGDAIVKIIGSQGVVSTFPIGGSGRQQVPFRVEFPSSKRITIEFDDKGTPFSDWIVLMSTRVR